jgi:hypothetical protein
MKTEKLYLASTGRVVHVGDTIKSRMSKDGITTITLVTITEKSIPMLLNSGILVSTPGETLSLNTVFERLSTKLGWKPQRVTNWLDAVSNLNPMAAFTIVAKEVAIILDEKYPDHIRNSERIFTISSLDGRVHEVVKAHIKSYRNFAAFRTLEDAKLACNILRAPLKEMFSSGK